MMRVHVVHPGVNWSLSDVYEGLCYGLVNNGARIVETKEQADWIIAVNGNLHAPDTLRQWRTIAPVAVLCTESPYDFELEVERMAVVDGGWTNERASVDPLRAVNPHVEYLPHGWHPEKHRRDVPDLSVPAHDVVFVGSGFSERVEWFNRIDWTGIDLGLYGLWDRLGLEESLEPCIQHDITINTAQTPTVALYRRAKMSLNLYRRKRGGTYDGTPRKDVHAESLSPRAYELAACGVFHLSTPRAEVHEVFGDLVPLIGGTMASAKDDERIIREWLARDDERAEIAALLPDCVAGASWVERAARVLQDLRAWNKVAA